MVGCPYMKYDWKQNCEVCKLTGEPTNGKLLCDFDFDTDCAPFQERANKDE